jgi:hypothetical protein
MKKKRKVTSKIIIRGLTVSGEFQKEWFKIFDLLDVIYGSLGKSIDIISFQRCFIRDFCFDEKALKEGTTKRKFSEFVLGSFNTKKRKKVRLTMGKPAFYKKDARGGKTYLRKSKGV